MAIDFDRFLEWAENRFPVVKVSGNEIKVDSVFADNDTKQHMWCNPLGGKKNRDHGVFHCWKTDQRGSLITLVRLVDKCSYEEALEILNAGDASMAQLELELEKFLNEKYYGIKKEPEIPQENNKAKLPAFTHLISSMSPNDLYRTQAEVYLYGRKLPIDNLYVCVNGEYRNRIIIPYYDQNGKLIYWNGRYLGENKNVLRYQGPDKKDFGVGKDDVLFVPEWPKLVERLYLTEGEFDAMTLKYAGLFSGAFGGKNLSELQMIMLKNYRVTLCLDNDKAGKNALPVMGKQLKSFGFVDVRYIRPPQQYKDWNQMLQNTNNKLIKAYILRKEKVYSDWTGDSMLYQNIT